MAGVAAVTAAVTEEAHVGEVSVRGLTKDFGRVRAVQELTFDVRPGEVTGFLGPNGAGKTTTLRMLLGLIRPTSGEATIGGRRFVDLERPRRVVGAVLEATGFYPGRTGADHLRLLAHAAGVPRTRVEQVLDDVQLTADAGRRVGGYSLGMRQRLGLAAALLGDPAVLILDEPANGLDPAGMAWLRGLLRRLAGAGRTVLISSHVLAEVAQTVDRVVIIAGGVLRFAGPLADLGSSGVVVRAGESGRLRADLARRGYRVVPTDGSTLRVTAATAEEVGAVAAESGIVLSALSDTGTSLEAAFLRLTGAASPADAPELSAPHPGGEAGGGA